MACTHIPIVAIGSDDRSVSQAKTKTKQPMQLKLAGRDLWHIVGHFDMKKSY